MNGKKARWTGIDFTGGGTNPRNVQKGSLLVQSVVIVTLSMGAGLGYAAWKEYRQRNYRDFRILFTTSALGIMSCACLLFFDTVQGG